MRKKCQESVRIDVGFPTLKVPTAEASQLGGAIDGSAAPEELQRSPPAICWAQLARRKRGSERRQDTPETCMIPTSIVNCSFMEHALEVRRP
mmetsp:Transcript_9610/g.22957  ORF Transcript_9610/g.22957 Transcript_9610/m.22957 type:complete len:92 (-) Transcript_9610:3483-3758(-)